MKGNKMNINRGIFLVGLFVFGVSPAFSQVKKPSMATLRSSGTNSGGSKEVSGYWRRFGTNSGGSPGTGSYTDLVGWCDESIGILEETKFVSTLAVQEGDIAGAMSTLEAGLNSAAQLYTYQPGSSLTFTAIDRILEMIDAIRFRISMPSGSLAERTYLDILYSSYEFIANVTQDIDVPVYIPYSYNYPLEDSMIESRFLSYIQKQYSWILDQFFRSDRDGVIIPSGSPEVLLTALEYITKNSVIDMEQSLYESSLRCLINDVDRLGNHLAARNMGNGLISDPRTLIHMVVSRLKHVIEPLNGLNSLSGKLTCNR